MVSLERAKELAIKEFSEYPIREIIDLGNRWAFCYDSGEPPVPGVCAVTVKKGDGKIGYLPVPPFENLDILSNGIVIQSIK